jgi:hypothetical protein
MNAGQRFKNRRTAALLERDVFEANLPAGLKLRGRQFRYECPICGGDKQWFGEDVNDFDPRVPCGGSERCIP